MDMPKDLETKEKILEWAARYPIPEDEGILINCLKSSDHFGEHITKDDLLEIVRWKSHRALGKARKNSEEDVISVSRRAFGSNSDVARVKILSELHGVLWPIASAILHLASTNCYPILDIYAALAVNAPPPQKFNDRLLEQYVSLCRATAKEHDISMRTLDRALITYGYHKSKDKSP